MREKARPPRRTTALACVVAAAGLGLLAGCGDDVGDKPDFSASEAPALWNPCDALDAGLVGEAVGTTADEQHGSAAKPDCRFVPRKEGLPVVDANYLLFPGGLDAAWDTMGIPEQADVTEPAVDGADAARLVVNEQKGSLSVTGFVQNGDLIQTVNVVDPAPYDAERVERGVVRMLTALSERADAQGVTDPSGQPSPATGSTSTDSPH
jgi:hypothetical protein